MAVVREVPTAIPVWADRFCGCRKSGSKSSPINMALEKTTLAFPRHNASTPMTVLRSGTTTILGIRGFLRWRSRSPEMPVASTAAESHVRAARTSRHSSGRWLYNRMWFHKDLLAVTMGGGVMNNPGRYLTLLPPIDGAWAASGTPYFTENPGQKAFMWDSTINLQYMPRQYITWWAEVGYRHSDVPYFAGRGGVTPPGGNNGYPQYYTCMYGRNIGNQQSGGGASSLWGRIQQYLVPGPSPQRDEGVCRSDGEVLARQQRTRTPGAAARFGGLHMRTFLVPTLVAAVTCLIAADPVWKSKPAHSGPKRTPGRSSPIHLGQSRQQPLSHAG